MADCSPLLEKGEGSLPHGLKPGASYAIKILDNPENPECTGFSLDGRRGVKSDIGDGGESTFASVHLKDVGLWQLSPGSQPDTVVLRLTRGHEGQEAGWCLAGSGQARIKKGEENCAWPWLEKSGTAEWLLEPAGEPGAAQKAFRLKAVSGENAGWYLGARADYRDYGGSWWVLMHQPGKQQEAVWSFQELTLTGRLKMYKDEMVRRAWSIEHAYEMIGLVAAFFGGYYLDVSMEIYSALRLFQDPSSFNLALAMVAIIFVSPLLCWFLLFANNLESPESVPWYLCHITPAIEVYNYLPRWRKWHHNVALARYESMDPPLPLQKSPALIWLPVCKAAFGSSMTTLFKVYGVFLVTRNFLLRGDLAKAPTGLLGVFLSVAISCASMGNSMVSLSNYGSSIPMTTRAIEIAWRSVEVASRVGTVAVLGIVFVEVHSIIAILMFDLIAQFTLLLVHPASRALMRNEMSVSMLVFWAFLMLLCAPPRFIPQLEDLHPAYYLIRVLELGLILAICGFRCGWLGLTAGTQSDLQVSLCEVANPLADSTPFWCRAIVFTAYLASALVPVIWAICQWQHMHRKALETRVEAFQREQAIEASTSAGCGEEPLAYGELLYLRAGSLPNRFLCVGDGQELEEAACRHYTEAMAKEQEDVAKAGWRVLPSGMEDESAEGGKKPEEKRYIRFGDIVRLSSALKDGLLLSGGRRGMNMYAATGMIVEDLRNWSLDYGMEEHYVWRICAISHKDGPDPSLRHGELVGMSARFAIQALPRIPRGEEIFLSSCRGSTTSVERTEVWTVSVHSRPATEDNPRASSWPSFELFAQRKLMVDSGDVVELTEALHQDKLRRGQALVRAARDQDVMMMTFMAQSGVPMWVTDESYLTPLHHFILGYARETQLFQQELKKNNQEPSGQQAPHKMPLKLFDSMLHSGMPHFELGAMQMYTPFHLAALMGQRGLCDLLLAAGADINAADAEGWTALHDAVLYDHRDMLCYLLSCKGLNPNAATLSGIKPLDLTEDDEVCGWLAAVGARAHASEAAPAEVPAPEPPEGRELPTNFEDPRENDGLVTARCNLDNQLLGSKVLAIRDTESGGACCMYCSRAGWNGWRSELCPLFKCPKCLGIHTIPYGNSLWSVCWCCQTCNCFPHQARLEPGKLDFSGKQAKTLFEKLDADGNGRLSKEEFHIFFEKFAGQGTMSLGEQGEGSSGKTLQSSYADQVFKRIDTDGSGDLSFEEFQQFFQEPEMPRGTKVKVVTAFTAIDNDHTELEVGLLGTVMVVDEEGDIGIRWQNGVGTFVDKRDISKLAVLERADAEPPVDSPSASFTGGKATSMARTTMRRRNTFSSMPCLESCLLLA